MAPIDCSGVAPAAGHSWFCKICHVKHESKVSIFPNQIFVALCCVAAPLWAAPGGGSSYTV